MEKKKLEDYCNIPVKPLKRTITTTAIDIAAWALGLSLIMAEKILNISPQLKAQSRVRSKNTK